MNYSLYNQTLTQTSKHLNLCAISLLTFAEILCRIYTYCFPWVYVFPLAPERDKRQWEECCLKLSTRYSIVKKPKMQKWNVWPSHVYRWRAPSSISALLPSMWILFSEEQLQMMLWEQIWRRITVCYKLCSEELTLSNKEVWPLPSATENQGCWKVMPNSRVFVCPGALATRQSNSVISDRGYKSHCIGSDLWRNWRLKMGSWRIKISHSGSMLSSPITNPRQQKLRSASLVGSILLILSYSGARRLIHLWGRWKLHIWNTPRLHYMHIFGWF